MDIRKDFESAAIFLHRLWSIGEEFHQIEMRRWVHLKNYEDFRSVYRMEYPRRSKLEDLYATGRGIAMDMSSLLKSFNYVGDYPTLTTFTEALAKSWAARIDEVEERLQQILPHSTAEDTPWAVHAMIEVWGDQIRLLAAVRDTAKLLQQTEIYRNEHGDFSMNQRRDQAIQVHTINAQGNVLVGSTDNSTSITISTTPVFASLQTALDGASIPSTEKAALSQCVKEMEAEVGKPGYLTKYQNFVAAAANHMSILGPFIPALTNLMSKAAGT